MEDGKKKFSVYTIKEKGEGQKSYWLRIGVAFVNRDGSFNLYLDALPVDGKLHVREWRDEERTSGEPLTVAESGAPRLVRRGKPALKNGEVAA